MSETYLEKSALAAHIAARKMKLYDPSAMDLEDLRQEAALAMWKNANRFDDEDQSNAYAFGAAVKECCKYIAKCIFAKEPFTSPLPESEKGDEELCTDDYSADELDGLAPEIVESLVEIFLDARVQKKGRAVDAAFRDVTIVTLVMSGYSNQSIATELGIPWRHVQRYRQSIRQVLRRYCQEHDIELEEKE